ncbi:MAG: Hsp20 family protein [Alphaproteobacteria bacterium]
MRSYDLSPLFRSTIGFDRWSDLFDTALRGDGVAQAAYPPYNIEKTGDDAYRITMAVAGFGKADLDVTQQENLLVVEGKHAAGAADGAQYLHRGIANRAFQRRFSLTDHVSVSDARLANGILEIALVREVPEAKRPRKVAIEAGAGPAVIEDKKAA